jgi:beta-glucosidase
MKFRDNNYTPEERLSDLLERLTLDEKVHMLSTHQYAVPRLGIGEWFVGCEVARGFVSKNPEEISTVFPQPIGLASTFDPELMERLGEIAGDEARYYYQKDKKGRLMLWGPTVDPERDPRWGRTEEAYGEDPYLIGEMTKAYTKGMAGDDPYYLKTIPTLKHFCANNNEAGRINCSADVSMRTLNEYYYEAFRIPITEGGAHSIMCAYNELAGVPACMNPDLEKKVKDEWGLDFIVTDGADFSQNVLAHHSHNKHSEALAAAIIENQSTGFLNINDQGKTDAVSGVSVRISGYVNLIEALMEEAAGVVSEEPEVEEEAPVVPENGTVVDAISGATISSTAVVNGVNRAVELLNQL